MAHPDEERTVDFDDEPELSSQPEADDRGAETGDPDELRLLDDLPPHWG